MRNLQYLTERVFASVCIRNDRLQHLVRWSKDVVHIILNRSVAGSEMIHGFKCSRRYLVDGGVIQCFDGLEVEDGEPGAGNKLCDLTGLGVWRNSDWRDLAICGKVEAFDDHRSWSSVRYLESGVEGEARLLNNSVIYYSRFIWVQFAVCFR